MDDFATASSNALSTSNCVAVMVDTKRRLTSRASRCIACMDTLEMDALDAADVAEVAESAAGPLWLPLSSAAGPLWLPLSSAAGPLWLPLSSAAGPLSAHPPFMHATAAAHILSRVVRTRVASITCSRALVCARTASRTTFGTSFWTGTAFGTAFCTEPAFCGAVGSSSHGHSRSPHVLSSCARSGEPQCTQQPSATLAA